MSAYDTAVVVETRRASTQPPPCHRVHTAVLASLDDVPVRGYVVAWTKGTDTHDDQETNA